MCGIAGYITKNSVDTSILEQMRDIFPYRGPDDAGLWQSMDKSIGLAHRRLSIIDTTDAGHQPMKFGSQEIWITFNGEIYNYIELKKELINKGYNFSTNTDTEVILASYLEWGNDCVKHFNGMWAFAIYDQRSKMLFLSRDRLGVKPLYYFIDKSNTIFFASEIKSILKGIKKTPEINHLLVDSFMSFGFIPGEDCLIDGIKRLMPAHNAYINLDLDIQVEKYWDLSITDQSDKGIDYYIKKGKELLNSSIDLRLRSDVPLGIFLSGGIDSSSVVGLLAERTSQQLKTFSVAYDFGNEFNETQYARVIAKKFQTDHHELIVSPKEFSDFIPKFIQLMDEPVTESAAISLYFVSMLAKEYVTVVLSGEGSDEIFAGYDFYKHNLVLERYRKILSPKIISIISDLSKKLPDGLNKIKKYLSLGGAPLHIRYKGISTYDESIKSVIYNKEFSYELRNQSRSDIKAFLTNLFTHTSTNDALTKMLYFDIKTWLVDDLLIKADRMSMAASLELRVPFLDYRLVEFAFNIPSHYKIQNGQTKYLLKRMVKGIVPDEIIHRKKMGFPTPLKIMFQNELKDYAYDILLSKSACLYTYFNRTEISSILAEHVNGTHDHHRIIWQLIVLEQWFNSYKGCGK